MRSLLLVGLFALSTSFALAQDPGAAGDRIKVDSMNQSIRMTPVHESDGIQRPDAGHVVVNLAQVQQKTGELNRLVKELNADMANLNKGMISADVNQRLKRIEKLAKELRQSLQ